MGQVDTIIQARHTRLHMVDLILKAPTAVVLGAVSEGPRLMAAMPTEDPISRLHTGDRVAQLGQDVDIHPMMQAEADRLRMRRRNPTQQARE